MGCQLKPISFKRLRRLVYRTFSEDRKLFEYHAAPQSMKGMCAHTYGRILRNRAELNLQAFEVRRDDEEIGFCVMMFKPFPLLFSFGLHPKFRTRDIQKEWLEAIGQRFNDDVWLVCVNDCNERAMRFFTDRGFTIEHHDTDYKYKFLLCPHLD